MTVTMHDVSDLVMDIKS